MLDSEECTAITQSGNAGVLTLGSNQKVKLFGKLSIVKLVLK